MENKLKYNIFLFALMLVVFGCRNYESKKYISIENDVIKEIIPQLTDLDAMLMMNDLCNIDIEMYVVSTLGVGKKIENLEDISFETLEEERNYERERKQFKPFIEKTIKDRILNIKIEYSNYSNLEIILVDEEIFKTEDMFLDLKEKNKFGILVMSRIIFNKNFDIGYLSYSFLCGEGCAWGYNIEIKKIDGDWEISEFFSGGIA